MKIIEHIPMAQVNSIYFYKTLKFEVLIAVLLNKDDWFILKMKAIKSFEESVAIFWL
jgi:hypothetical protein